MDRAMVSPREAADRRYICSDAVQTTLAFFKAREKDGYDGIPPDILKMHLVTFRNYQSAYKRLSEESEKQVEYLEKRCADSYEKAKRALHEAQAARAFEEGIERELNRAAGEHIPTDAPKPVVEDFEVAAADPTEGAKRRKTLLKEREQGNAKAVRDELPSATPREKQLARAMAIGLQRVAPATAIEQP